jgi:ABC-type glutathione transport system ATPase component
MSAAEPILVLEDTHRVHGTGAAEVHALRGVSLAVRPGELVAVMGPAGLRRCRALAVGGGCDLRRTARRRRVRRPAHAGEGAARAEDRVNAWQRREEARSVRRRVLRELGRRLLAAGPRTEQTVEHAGRRRRAR